MIRKLITLILSVMAIAILTGCEDKDNTEIGPGVIDPPTHELTIAVTDENGNDLLNPETAYNIINNANFEFKVRDEKYSTVWWNDSPKGMIERLNNEGGNMACRNLWYPDYIFNDPTSAIWYHKLRIIKNMEDDGLAVDGMPKYAFIVGALPNAETKSWEDECVLSWPEKNLSWHFTIGYKGEEGKLATMMPYDSSTDAQKVRLDYEDHGWKDIYRIVIPSSMLTDNDGESNK